MDTSAPRVVTGSKTGQRSCTPLLLSYITIGLEAAAYQSRYVGFHSRLVSTQFPAPLKVEAAALLPETKMMLEAKIQSTEGRLKALRALQPDENRLDRLRSTEMAATAERLKQLDAKATAEAAAVADLHNQHKAVQQKLQVRLPSSTSIPKDLVCQK